MAENNIKKCDDCICLHCTNLFCEKTEECDGGFMEEDYIELQSDIQKCYIELCCDYR